MLDSPWVLLLHPAKRPRYELLRPLPRPLPRTVSWLLAAALAALTLMSVKFLYTSFKSVSVGAGKLLRALSNAISTNSVCA